MNMKGGTGLRTNTKKTTFLGTKLPLVWEQLSRKHAHGLRTVTFWPDLLIPS